MAGKDENGYEKPPRPDAALLEKAIRTVDRATWGYSLTFSKSLSLLPSLLGEGHGVVRNRDFIMFSHCWVSMQ
jgi:hypothetical protein